MNHGGVPQTMRLVIPVIVATLLAGCVSPLPVEELRHYDSAFEEAQTAANALFDDLAIAETRMRDKAGGDGDAGGVTPANIRDRLGYDPQYYPGEGLAARVEDPETTRQLRRAMSVVARYNDILLMLAEGRTIDEIQAQTATLRGNTEALMPLVGIDGGLVAGVALTTLSQVLQSVEGIRSRKAFQEAFLAGHGEVETIISGLKNAAPVIYPILIDRYEDQIADASFDFGEDSPAYKNIQADAVGRINTYRQAVQSYERMFSRVEAAFAEVRTIMEAPQSFTSTTLILAEQTAMIRGDIDEIRQAFALLRVGPGEI